MSGCKYVLIDFRGEIISSIFSDQNGMNWEISYKKKTGNSQICGNSTTCYWTTNLPWKAVTGNVLLALYFWLIYGWGNQGSCWRLDLPRAVHSVRGSQCLSSHLCTGPLPGHCQVLQVWTLPTCQPRGPVTNADFRLTLDPLNKKGYELECLPWG